MQIELELLAPAKNRDIGIAAISCGADAVYIAAQSFGAREAAGNSLEEIEELISYAHSFNARIYVTINTILYQEELEQVRTLIHRLYSIGADALIVQDMAIAAMENLPPIPLFASTQCNIRTPDRARFLSAVGFQRLILARELSLEQIAEVHRATPVPIEAFVHGALCVSYSGQCYLSQEITGRSANRGACAQACRWPYTLEDASGRVLVENQPLLSLKDLDMSSRIGELVAAGVTSFKIEGRLKNESYVRNTVSLYNRVLNDIIRRNPGYKRASAGVVSGGFEPAPQKTFNRGFTTLFADGVRAMWLSASGAKGNGEEVGRVLKVMRNADGTTLFTYMPKGKVKPIENGDGLCFYLNGREIAGARASLCKGNTIYTNESFQLERGAQIFRNLDIAFEREIKSNAPKREIPVNLHFEQIGDKYRLVAEWEYGRIDYAIGEPCQPARNRERAEETLKEQLSKSSGCFSFNLVSINCREVPFFPISLLNGFRRAVAALAAERIEQMIRQRKSAETLLRPVEELSARVEGDLTYLANVSNSLSREFYALRGAGNIAPAYELERAPGAELMRTKYCLRYELGICPHGRNNPQGILAQRTQEIEYPLYLRNGGTKLQLSFDCKLCEMRIKRVTFAD